MPPGPAADVVREELKRKNDALQAQYQRLDEAFNELNDWGTDLTQRQEDFNRSCDFPIALKTYNAVCTGPLGGSICAMYAVIKTGGKQYKVAANDEIVVEKIDGKDAGDEFAFEDVLMIGDGDKVTVGAPSVKGAAVVGEVVEHGKGDKVIIFKKRQRSTYKRKRGHRQLQTIVKITEIMADGFDASKLKKASKKPAAKAEEAPEAKKAAPKKAAAKAEVKEEAPKAKTAAAPKEDAPKAKAEAPKKTGATKKETAASDDRSQNSSFR